MNHQLFEYSYQLKKENQKKFLGFVSYFILLFLIVNIILSFLIFPVKQISSSMLPDISEQTVVMVSKINKTPERGSVVLLKPNVDRKNSFAKKALNKIVSFFTLQKIFMYENNNFPGEKSELRRVVGLPGDTIFLRDYVLYIKPAGEKHFLTEFEIIDKPYNVTFFIPPANWDGTIGVEGYFDEIVLGQNEYFVLGDNRKSCEDSRLWGPVTMDKIEAKVLFAYFPFNKFKWFAR